MHCLRSIAGCPTDMQAVCDMQACASATIDLMHSANARQERFALSQYLQSSMAHLPRSCTQTELVPPSNLTCSRSLPPLLLLLLLHSDTRYVHNAWPPQDCILAPGARANDPQLPSCGVVCGAGVASAGGARLMSPWFSLSNLLARGVLIGPDPSALVPPSDTPCRRALASDAPSRSSAATSGPSEMRFEMPEAMEPRDMRRERGLSWEAREPLRSTCSSSAFFAWFTLASWLADSSYLQAALLMRASWQPQIKIDGASDMHCCLCPHACAPCLRYWIAAD